MDALKTKKRTEEHKGTLFYAATLALKNHWSTSISLEGRKGTLSLANQKVDTKRQGCKGTLSKGSPTLIRVLTVWPCAV